MTPLAIHFVDPTIPGISGRDLIDRPIKSVQTIFHMASGAYRTQRADFALRKSLSKLDAHQLRDLGIDRGAA